MFLPIEVDETEEMSSYFFSHRHNIHGFKILLSIYKLS